VTDDLVKRLREEIIVFGCPTIRRNPDGQEAADRIEQLEAALRPLAEKYLWPDDTGFADEIRSDEDWDEQYNNREPDDMWIERGWIRAARAALGEKKNG